ncbi:hypothetical protein Lal_00013114 [Lupinus albus]|nr:hypothetical protein Lal_00013114 [Lupinus albus]
MLNALAATPKCMHPDRQCPSRWPPSPPVFFPISTNFTSTLGIPPSSPELKPASIKSYSQPGLLLTLPSSSSRAKELYNPKAFITHAALLDQACAHCPIFPTAASRRSLGRVSVPVWLIILSDQLRIAGLVSHYLTNYLIRRGPLSRRKLSPEGLSLLKRCTDDPHCADPHQETNTPRPQRLPTAAACASLLTTRYKLVNDPAALKRAASEHFGDNPLWIIASCSAYLAVFTFVVNLFFSRRLTLTCSNHCFL